MRYKLNKRIIAVCISCVLACCFSVLTVAATDIAPTQTGSVTVTVEPEAEGVEMQLYAVADFINGKYQLNDSFAACNVDLTDLQDADSSQLAAETLQSFAKDKSLAGTPANINSDGKAVFTNLSSETLYLVVQTSASDYTIQPLLTCVPYMDGNTPVYDITITAKFTKDVYSAVILNKVGAEDKALQGAVFSFQSKTYYTDASQLPQNADKGKDSNGTYFWKSYGADLTTNAQGQIVVEKLPFGDYRFIELEAPKDYKLDSTPHEFSLNSVGTVKVENGIYKKDSGNIAELTVKNELIPITPSEPSENPPINPPVLTSDPSNIVPFVLMIIIAGTVIALTVKRTSKND